MFGQIGKEGRVVNSNMGWHAIALADGTEVRLQTSGIKQLGGAAAAAAGAGAGAGAAAMQVEDVGGVYDDISDGSDPEFTPDLSLLLSSRASAPASALKQPARLSKQQPPSSIKTGLLSTLAVTEPSKKLALKPSPSPKPVKSTSAPPRSGSGRQPASGKRKGAPDTFAEGTQVGGSWEVSRLSNPARLHFTKRRARWRRLQVVVVGNKRTSEKLIGREAVVIEYKPTGWHTIQMIDTSEAVRTLFSFEVQFEGEWRQRRRGLGGYGAAHIRCVHFAGQRSRQRAAALFAVHGWSPERPRRSHHPHASGDSGARCGSNDERGPQDA